MLAMLVLVTIAGAGYYEDFADAAVDYVTDPNTPTTGTDSGLVDQTTGLAWVQSWGATPDAPRLENQSQPYWGSFFYNTAAIILGQSATGIRTNLGHAAVNYVFGTRADADDTLDEPGAGNGIEPWWSDTQAFYNGYFDLPTGLLVPDASFWNRNAAPDYWPQDTDEVTLEWMLWDAIYLTYTGDLYFQDEIDMIIDGVLNSPYFDNVDSTIQLFGSDDPYLTALWSIVLIKYNDVFGGSPLMRTTDGGSTYSYYDRLIQKAMEYVQTNGLDYMYSRYMGDLKNVSEGMEDYEALAFLMAYALAGDTTEADSVFDTYIIEADVDNDGDPWGFVLNIADFGNNFHTNLRYFPLHHQTFTGMLSILALKEYHDFMLPFDFVSADTCADWIRFMADSLVEEWWADSVGRFCHNPNWQVMVPVNGLAGYSMKQVPRMEILDVASNLPHQGDGIICDYYANRTQSHIVSVTVVAHHTIADSTDTLWLFTGKCMVGWGLLDFQWELLPTMNPGDTAVITFNTQASDCAPAPDIDWVWAELYGPHCSGYSVVDDDIIVEVDDPAHINVDDVVAVADIAGTPYNEPYFTQDQLFYLQVDITNTGDALLKDVVIDVSSTSAYGCASTFAPTNVFSDVNIPGGASISFYIPIWADPLNSGALGTDDEIFQVTAAGVDSNTMDSCMVTYTDDDDSIGIVMPPELHVRDVTYDATDPHPSGLVNYWGNFVYWLNATDPMEFQVTLYSEDGDYATADSLDVYDVLTRFFNDGGYEATAIAGTTPPLWIQTFPGGAPTDNIGPGDTVRFSFELTDNGISPDFEDTLTSYFEANFHDANRADDGFASTSPFDTTFNTLLVDVTPPNAWFVEPYASSDPWPTDDVVQLGASDNHSGVEFVGCVIEEVGGQFWNGTGWQATADTFVFGYDDSTGNWLDTIPEPTGVTSYTMQIWAVDSAGNVGSERFLPRGDVAYIHIYNVLSDLPRELAVNQRWESDWLQEHTVTVHVYNEFSSPIDNIELGLRSSVTHTSINGNPREDIVNIGTLNPGEHRFIDFTVVEPMYDVEDDTLLAFLHTADPSAGRVIGLHYTDRNAFIRVEEPAKIYIDTTWNDAPAHIADTTDTAIITMDSIDYQHMTVYTRVCYAGGDTLEYLRIRFDNGALHFPISLVGPATVEIAQNEFTTYYDDPVFGPVWCTTISTEYMADSNECHNREAEDMFIVSVDSFDFDNWEPADAHPTYTQFFIDDDVTFATVVEPPRLDILDGTLSGGYPNGGYIWINRTNSIHIDIPFWNLLSTCSDSGRATARLTGENMPLVFFDDLWSEITGLSGLIAPTSTHDTLFPGASDTLAYTIQWDGLTDVNDLVAFMVDTIWFRNQYWQTQPYPVPWLFVGLDTLGDPIFIQPEMDTISNYIYAISDTLGIDVVIPTVNILNPDQPLYSAWTWEETLLVSATDNFSGVDNTTVEGMLVDPRGMFWNGTTWQTDTFWLALTVLGGGQYWTAMPDTADLVAEGIYYAYARCSDVAGNPSDVDEIDFVYDATSPITQIFEPDDGDTTVYYKCSYGDTIRAIAWDTVVVSDPTAVAGVYQAYVAIEDTFNNLWWDATLSDWVTSMSAIYNPMTFESGETWYYTGIVPLDDSYVFRVFTYADDMLFNFDSPTDSLDILVDCDKPECFITDPTYTTAPTESVFSSSGLLPNTWDAIMLDAVYGYVTDSIMAVDSVKLAISKDDSLWWDDFVGDFVVSGSPIWFYPDNVWLDEALTVLAPMPELNPGLNLVGADTIWYDYAWTPDGSGCYELFTIAWDDIDNQSDTASWRFAVDNMDPDSMAAYYPYNGQVCTLYTWQETLRVAVYDTMRGCLGWFNNIDSAKIALQFVVDGEVQWWTGSTWSDTFTWIELDPGAVLYEIDGGDTTGAIFLWNMWVPVTALQNGTYNAQVQARTQTDDYINFYYNFVISGGLGYLTVQVIDPTPIFVGDSVRVELAAHHTSGTIDTTFYYGITLGSNYDAPGCIDLPSSPYYLERGCDTFWIHPSCGKKGIIIWANSDPSGYAPGNTMAFDVISELDPHIYATLDDVAPDQGEQIMIIHTCSDKDPLYLGGDIDTSTIKVTSYDYQIFDGIWTDITPDSIVESGGTLYVYYTPGNFDLSEYQIVVNYHTNLDPMIDFDTLYNYYVGSIAPVDDIAPAAVADVRIEQTGGNVHLWWDEITEGYEGSPELDPATNIYYIIYKSNTDPYEWGEYAVVDTEDTPEYTEPLPADPIAEPTYYYVVAYDHDGNLSDNSERVGRTSYEFGPDWGQIAVPFDVEEYDPLMGSQLATYLAPADVINISRWDNTVFDWVGVYVPPTTDGVVNEESDVLIVLSTNTTTLSIAGDIPASVPSISYLAGGWNSMMVPLNRPDITMASEMIVAIGSSECSAIAHRSPDRGWGDMCVWSGTTFFGDFPVYPGQGYLMWAETDGSWPTTKSSPTERTMLENPTTVDCGSMPKALIGYIDGEWESVRFNLTNKAGDILLTENSYGCSISDGKFLVQLGNIGWKKGDEYILKFYTDDENPAQDEVVVVLNDAPAQHLGDFFLKPANRIPTMFALRGATPNPFNATTEIKFELPVDSKVKIEIFDVAGKRVADIVDGNFDAGYHSVVWNAKGNDSREVPTGVYFCKMKAGEFSAVTKLMLVK